jgi:hypothetical protein
MAKKATAAAPAKTKTTAVATKNNDPGLPAHLQGYKSTGAGVPNKMDDFLIPMAKVLGPQSPEVLKNNPNQVKGAEAGDIMIKNAPVPLIKAEAGFLFQPCYRDEAVIEWLPRGKGGGGGAGFVARHPADYIENSGNAKRVPDPQNKERMVWVNAKTGNGLVHTRYYSGFLVDEKGKVPPMPLVLPFASTGHTAAKQWNMMIAQQRIGDGPADIWLVYYKVSTRLRQRADQSWYIFDIANAGDDGEPMWVPSIEDAERGKTLHESLARGERKINYGEEGEGAGQSGGDSM